MFIDWVVLATIAAPVITPVVVIALTRFFESSPKLICYHGHISTYRVESGVEKPFNVNSHSLVIKNLGRKPARNVTLTHFMLPNVHVHPMVSYETKEIPQGGKNIVFDSIRPREQITVSYLYYPPVTFDQVNASVTSDEGEARFLPKLPTIETPWPNWRRIITIALAVVGAVAIAYTLIILSIR